MRNSLKLLLLIALVGCGDNTVSDASDTPGAEGGMCLDGGTCDTGLSCVSERCVDLTELVDEPRGPDATPDDCSDSSDCQAEQVCVSGLCRTNCDSDNDCTPMGLLCSRSKGVCGDTTDGSSGALDAGGSDGGSNANALVDARIVGSGNCATPTISFVIDGSGSMSDAFGAVSRWDALRTVLLQDGVIARYESEVAFGLMVYDAPFSLGAVFGADAGTCLQLTVVEPALDNATEITVTYPVSPPAGTTPTHLALQSASEALPNEAQAALDGVGRQTILLITDGTPNDLCGTGADDSMPEVLAATSEAAARGIEVHVIGLTNGDTILEAHLMQVADAGGGTLALPSTVDELSAVIDAVVASILTCPNAGE